MEVYLLRHGTAESVAPRDQDRRLSAAGREGLTQLFDECKTALAGVEHVLVSPYVRTMQTLNMALPYLPLMSFEKCESVDWLTPGGSPKKVMECLSQLQVQSVLLITHQPLVGTLLNEMCDLEPGYYRMGTGALALVELDIVAMGLGKVKWLKQAL